MGNGQEKKKEELQQDPIEKVEDKPVKQEETKRQATEKDMEQVTNDTKRMLDKQKKVKIRLHLPQDTNNKLKADEEAGKKVEWPFQEVSINGHIYQIQLGKSVEVPQSVADVLEQAGLI